MKWALTGLAKRSTGLIATVRFRENVEEGRGLGWPRREAQWKSCQGFQCISLEEKKARSERSLEFVNHPIESFTLPDVLS